MERNLPVENARLYQELVGHVKGKRTLFVTGTGVSIGATSKATASWAGLIADGIQYCLELDVTQSNWAEAQMHKLSNENNDADDLIHIASKLEKKLRGDNRTNGNWSNWLRRAIGDLKVLDRTTVTHLHTLGRGRLATCNYDDVLTADNYPAVPWTLPADVIRVLSGEERGVLHLHGHWKTPDSVVLGNASYAELLYDNAAQSLQRFMASLPCLVLVGFGAGLEDPNFGGLLNWVAKTFPMREAHHFWLVPHSDVERATKSVPKGCRVAVLEYGEHYADLPQFLERLVANTGLDQECGEHEKFVGRDREIDEFSKRIKCWLDAAAEPMCVAIDGLGGAGKTWLAQVLLNEAAKFDLRAASVLASKAREISESRLVMHLQREVADAVSLATKSNFARFGEAIKAGLSSLERSKAWHEDLGNAIDTSGCNGLVILLDDYERLSSHLRSRSEAATDADDQFCHPWVRDAIIRSAPLRVLWILAGRGSSRLSLPANSHVIRLSGLERGAVFKLVKASGSKNPLDDTNRLMEVTGGHALAVRVALRGGGFPDDETGHDALSSSDAEVVVRTLRYLWVEQEAGSQAAAERDAVVALALAGGLPKAVADKALQAGGLADGEEIASRLWRTFPELFGSPGALDGQVAAALLRTLVTRIWSSVDPDRIATRVLSALSSLDRERLDEDERLEIDAAMVSLTAWLRPQDGVLALTRCLLRSHVSGPGLRRAIVELDKRPAVQSIAGWQEISSHLPADRIFTLLRHNTKEAPSLRLQLEMASDALSFDNPNTDLEIEALPSDGAEKALVASDSLGREVAAYWLSSLATLTFNRGALKRSRQLWVILASSAPTVASRARARNYLAMCAAYDARPTEVAAILGSDVVPSGLRARANLTTECAKDKKLKRARKLLESRDAERAHELVLGMVNEFPGDPAVLERLVHTSRRAGAEGPKVPDDPTRQSNVRFIIYIGELALRDGDIDKAERYFLVSEKKALTKLNREATRESLKLLANATSRLAEIALFQGQIKEANQLFNKSISLGEKLSRGFDDCGPEDWGGGEHARVQTKHARTIAGFVRLLLDDQQSAAASFGQALSLDPDYFHAHLGQALCGVDPDASLIAARKSAQRVPRNSSDPILSLDLALLAALVGEDRGLPPLVPRDAGKLLLFALRLEAASRSSLAGDSLGSLYSVIGDWLALRPPWLRKA